MVKSLVSKFRGFFLVGHERTLLAKKNIAFSLAIKGVAISISLLLVPITISYVNPVQYGIWLTLSSIIGWFGFFDIGLGNGLKNKLAESNALKETINSKTYISTTYAMISLIALVLFVIFLILNIFLNWSKILNTPNIHGLNLNLLALIVFGSFCLQLISQTLNSVLLAFHSVSKVSLINLVGQFACLLCLITLKKVSSESLLYLVLALAGLPLLVQIGANIWCFKKEYSLVSPSFKMVNFKYAKSLLSVGGLFFFIQIGALLLFQTDNIVITQLFGPREVTVYNISYKLFAVIFSVFSIIMTPFWAAFTDAYSQKDYLWIKDIFRKMYKYLVVVALLTFSIVILSSFIIKIWLGDSIKVPFMLSFVMGIYVITWCWQLMHCYLINGIGKIRMQFYLFIISTIINIPMAFFLGKWIGVIGVTISNIIILVIQDVVLYIQCNKLLNGTAKGVWYK